MTDIYRGTSDAQLLAYARRSASLTVAELCDRYERALEQIERLRIYVSAHGSAEDAIAKLQEQVKQLESELQKLQR